VHHPWLVVVPRVLRGGRARSQGTLIARPLLVSGAVHAHSALDGPGARHIAVAPPQQPWAPGPPQTME
jgi:hypothetical protein